MCSKFTLASAVYKLSGEKPEWLGTCSVVVELHLYVPVQQLKNRIYEYIIVREIPGNELFFFWNYVLHIIVSRDVITRTQTAS